MCSALKIPTGCWLGVGQWTQFLCTSLLASVFSVSFYFKAATSTGTHNVLFSRGLNIYSWRRLHVNHSPFNNHRYSKSHSCKQEKRATRRWQSNITHLFYPHCGVNLIPIKLKQPPATAHWCIMTKLSTLCCTQIDYSEEESTFLTVASQAMGVLVLGVSSRLDSSLQEMVRLRWDTLENPGDDSPYVNTIRKVRPADFIFYIMRKVVTCEW